MKEEEEEIKENGDKRFTTYECKITPPHHNFC